MMIDDYNNDYDDSNNDYDSSNLTITMIFYDNIDDIDYYWWLWIINIWWLLIDDDSAAEDDDYNNYYDDDGWWLWLTMMMVDEGDDAAVDVCHDHHHNDCRHDDRYADDDDGDGDGCDDVGISEAANLTATTALSPRTFRHMWARLRGQQAVPDSGTLSLESLSVIIVMGASQGRRTPTCACASCTSALSTGFMQPVPEASLAAVVSFLACRIKVRCQPAPQSGQLPGSARIPWRTAAGSRLLVFSSMRDLPADTSGGAEVHSIPVQCPAGASTPASIPFLAQTHLCSYSALVASRSALHQSSRAPLPTWRTVAPAGYRYQSAYTRGCVSQATCWVHIESAPNRLSNNFPQSCCAQRMAFHRALRRRCALDDIRPSWSPVAAALRVQHSPL